MLSANLEPGFPEGWVKETKLILEVVQVGMVGERGYEEALQAWRLEGSPEQEKGFVAGSSVSILGSFKGLTM